MKELASEFPPSKLAEQYCLYQQQLQNNASQIQQMLAAAGPRNQIIKSPGLIFTTSIDDQGTGRFNIQTMPNQQDVPDNIVYMELNTKKASVEYGFTNPLAFSPEVIKLIPSTLLPFHRSFIFFSTDRKGLGWYVKKDPAVLGESRMVRTAKIYDPSALDDLFLQAALQGGLPGFNADQNGVTVCSPDIQEIFASFGIR